MSFTQMLFAADFCPPFDPGLKFSKKSKTSRPAEIHPVFISAYKYGSGEHSWGGAALMFAVKLSKW